MFTACSSLPRKKCMISLTDHPDKTEAADGDVKQQNIKLFARIQLVSYHPYISNEMS